MASYWINGHRERIEKSVIDSRTAKAKKEFKQEFIDTHGYWYCELCGRNDCNFVAVSHKISVDWAQKNGHSELAYDKGNMQAAGQKCHQEYDTQSRDDKHRF